MTSPWAMTSEEQRLCKVTDRKHRAYMKCKAIVDDLGSWRCEELTKALEREENALDAYRAAIKASNDYRFKNGRRF